MAINSEMVGLVLLACVIIAWGISVSDFVMSIIKNRRWTIDDTLILLVHVVFPLAIMLSFYVK